MRQLADSQQQFYAQHHRDHTVASVQQQRHKYAAMQQGTMTMAAALAQLNEFVDPSDPDLDEPNLVHAYQTAEMIRRQRPEDTDLQLTGLLHDVGKVLFRWGEPATQVVGDTFVVGCAYPASIIHHDALQHNPEAQLYPTPCGRYAPHCGLDRLLLSYGHDEYLYQVLRFNRDRHALPERYWNVVRYHSFYPWHSSGAYRHLMAPGDEETLRAVQDFNQFDLYSKAEQHFEVTPAMRAYYDRLLRQCFPEPLSW